MEDWMNNLTATSNALESEVGTHFQFWTNATEIAQWVQQEIAVLKQTNLALTSSTQQEDWLKKLFIALRLQFLAKDKKTSLNGKLPAAPNIRQAAQIEVLDILSEVGAGSRVCALGAGTYEMMMLRLQAMAALECTLIAAPATYIKRFCLDYGRLGTPLNSTQAKQNWLALLLSLQQALVAEATPQIPQTKDAPRQAQAPSRHKSKKRGQSTAQPIQTKSEFSSWRERVLIFGSVFGIFFFCYILVLGSPAWILVQIKEQNKLAKAQPKVTAPSLQAQAGFGTQPGTAPTPAPEITPSPSAFPTSEATATPIATPMSTPVPATTASEQAGFYVIGLASREEASAQIEAQKHREAGLNPQVVFSSNWSGLTPNYYQVVYGIFTNRADTATLRKELDQRGIKTYVMHSGQQVQH